MLSAHTKFWYEMGVLADGFRWTSPEELGAGAMIDRAGRPLRFGPARAGVRFAAPAAPAGVRFLVPNAPAGVRPIAKADRPDDNPTLFIEFAELNDSEPEALLRFANAHGELGCPAVVFCDPTGPAAGLYFTSVSRPEDRNPIDGKAARSLRAETLADWTTHIIRLRTAIAVFDALRDKGQPDRKRLSALFRWTPDEEQEGLDHWVLDTHPETPPAPIAADRIREPVRGWPANRFDDVSLVARWWLVSTVNDALDGVASPVLAIDEKGALTEELAPKTLLAVLWSQLFRAISGNKSYEKCKACEKLFEVSPGDRGSTVRRRYCSDACRVRKHRDRQQQAVALSKRGMKPRQIVEQFASEGYDVHLDAVKKWVQNAPPKRK
jgi:hypothetical protein